MNTIVLVGNIGQHPVLRYTSSDTPVANVTLATNRVYRDRAGDRQQTTEWHRLVVWGEGAENFARIVGKGDLLAVRGRLEYRQREIAGEKVQDASIRVLEWTKLSTRKAQPEDAAEAEEQAEAAAGAATPEGLTLETEIEGPPFGPYNDQEAAPSETTEPTGADAPEPTAPGEALPGETATEQDIPFPKPHGRKR